MRPKPYVYILVHKTTKQFYIGYRSANIVHAEEDFGVAYFTSSKVVADLGFYNFFKMILYECATANEAYDCEQHMISVCWGNPLLINKHVRLTVPRFKMTGSHTDATKVKLSVARKRRPPASEETRKKMSLALKGRKRPAEVCANISRGKKGKATSIQKGGHLSQKHKQHLSEAKKGRPLSEDHKQKLREAWVRRRANKVARLVLLVV